jgi:hypothetical protein
LSTWNHGWIFFAQETGITIPNSCPNDIPLEPFALSRGFIQLTSLLLKNKNKIPFFVSYYQTKSVRIHSRYDSIKQQQKCTGTHSRILFLLYCACFTIFCVCTSVSQYSHNYQFLWFPRNTACCCKYIHQEHQPL